MIIQKIPISSVESNLSCFNTCNNFTEDEMYINNQELFYKNYFDNNEKYNYSKWHTYIDKKYMDPCLFITEISLGEIDELLLLGNLALIYEKIPHNDNYLMIDSLIKKLDSLLKNIDTNNLFIKLDSCSPKDSFIKDLPIKSSKDIIDHIITSRRCINTLNSHKNYKKEINLIVKKFDNDIDINNEYRIFIKNKKITCVSQYRWFKNVGITDLILYKLHDCLMDKDFQHQIDKLPCSDCILDISYNNNDILKIIELNPFGSKSPTGSALFNWERDELIINKGYNEIYFRITC